MWKQLSLTFFICVNVWVSLSAQKAYFRHFGKEQGLDCNFIYDLYVDSKGFLWIATDQGLWTYNGFTFSVLPFQNTQGLAVSSINESSDGRIWCQNFGNQIFKVVDNALQPVVEINSRFGNENLTNFFTIQNDKIWFSKRDSIYLFDAIKECVVAAWDTKDDRIVGLGMYASNNLGLFVPTYNSEVLFFSNNQAVQRKSIKGYPSNTRGIQMYDDRILICDRNIGMMLLYDKFFNALSSIKIPLSKGQSLIHIVKDPRFKQIWVCSDDGIWQLDSATLQPNYHLFGGEATTDLVYDPAGGLWVSTYENGLYYQQSNALAMIAETNKNPYLQIESANRKSYAIQKSGFLIETDAHWQPIRTIKQLTRKDVLHIDTLHDAIYLGDGALYKNRMTNRNGPKDIAYLPNNMIACASSESAYTVSFKGYIDSLEKVKYVQNHRSRTMTLLGNTLYVGSVDGLNLFTIPDNTFKKTLRHNNEEIIAVSAKTEGDSALWLGSINSGLFLIKGDSIVSHYTSASGLLSNNIIQIALSSGNVWVVTSNGVSYLDKKENRFLNYNTAWLPSILDCYAVDDSLIISTSIGVLSLHKSIFYKASVVSHLSLQLFDDKGSLHDQTKVPSSHSGLYAQIKISAWNIGKESIVEYRFLGTNDTNWIRLPENQTNIDLRRLSYGSHVLELRVISERDLKVITQRQFNFVIEPKFWQTTIFKCAVFLLFAFSIWQIIRFAVLRVRKEESNRREVLRSQLTALRVQLNPHFIYNVLNTLQAMIFTNRKKEAHEVIGHFSDLMRGFLEKSTEMRTSIEEEIELIEKYLKLEQFRFEGKLDYHFELLNLRSNIKIPTLLVQPYVENAVKHGLKHKIGIKMIILRFELLLIEQREVLKISIEDNGVGRAAAAEINKRSEIQSTAFSTKANQSRVDILNTLWSRPIDIKIIDQEDDLKQAIGTKVVITIPIEK